MRQQFADGYLPTQLCPLVISYHSELLQRRDKRAAWCRRVIDRRDPGLTRQRRQPTAVWSPTETHAGLRWSAACTDWAWADIVYRRVVSRVWSDNVLSTLLTDWPSSRRARLMAFRSRRSSFARNLKSLDPEYVDYEMDAGLSAADKNQWFFEVGWEVANKGELSG